MDSIFFALIFLILGSPYTYNLVDRAVGQPLLRTRIIENGVPTRTGLVVHSLVFALIYYFFTR